MEDDSPKVADYFVTVGLNNLKKPESDTETLDPITDVAVIFKSLGEEPPKGFECVELTPSGFPADLNHGSIRTQSCYLCFKRGRDKPPLMDIGVLFEGKQKLMHGCDIVHKTPSKHIANVNNGSNMRIFITYRRASPQFSHSSLAVIEICVILANKGEKPPHAFNLIDKNLNQGLVGSEVYLCYRKSLARSNTLSYAAEIISRYPLVDGGDYLLPDSISLFCLPLGAVIECWPEKAQHPLPIFSTFALTCGKGEKIYGGGVTFFEEFDSTKLTDEVLELIDQQQQNHKDDRVVAQTNRCICLLSRYPFFQAFRRFLLSLYRLSLSAKQTIPIERYVAHFMHRIPFPTPQKPIVHVQLTHEGFEITQPNDGPLPVSGASFTDLLRCLGSEKTLTLLCCILTEQKILVHSLRPALLTSVCEALTSLIFPFQWKCPYIPLCPLKLADVLFAPFPFIYGVDSRYFDRAQPPQDVTCVDLDTHMITQAVDKDRSFISGKLLPKKPAKCLKDKLDEIFPQLYPVKSSDDISSAVDMAPLDDAADVATDKKKKTIELYIQEAFLRFHAQILQGYKQYLLPITSQPDLASRDVNSLFDLQGFMKSRPRGTERFYQMLVKTQLFSHFIETRSFTHSGHVNVLVFFDDCIDKCDTPARLLRGETKSSNATTVVVTPPDASGLPPGQVYTYNGFPKLNPDLYVLPNPSIQNLKASNVSTPPRSPIIGRTPHERQLGTLSAKKQANSPTLWARCLLGHCFTIWFIHLPSYVKSHKKKKKILYKAFEVIQRINKSKAKLPDEVCYRILIQLSGQLNHPALAVKVLFEMKRVGVQINAVTWGDYHKAVLESKWEPDLGDKTNAQQLWTKVRLVFMAMFAFRKAIYKSPPAQQHVETDLLINLEDGVKPFDKDTNDMPTPLETSSLGTASDAGYSSGLISIEDLSRSQPASGSLSDLRQHRRNFSNTSELSECSVEEFVIKKTSISRAIPNSIKRRQSETSIGSNMSDGTAIHNSTNSHIIVQHESSLPDSTASSLLNSSLDLFENIGQLLQTSSTGKPDVMLEAVICSCQVCNFCHKVIYDEEVMGGWSADDSNLNIICPFCQTKKVPTLEIRIKDYRGLKSKVCSTNSLSSSTCSANFSKALAEARGSVSTSNPLLNLDDKTDTLIDVPLNENDNNMNLLEEFLSPSVTTNPVPIQTNKDSSDGVLSTSAPTSASGSPVTAPAARSRPTVYKHRKSSSASSGGSFSMIFGTPGEKVVNSVPYLSPLVLRKELENLLENHGDSMLQNSRIVDEKPIIYWNLLWYFRRMNLISHLPSLLLQSYNEKSEDHLMNCVGEVLISTSWDLNRQTKDHIPLYMLWSLPSDQHEVLTQQGYTKKSVLSTITHHIQQNDVVVPMKMLLDERCRKQEQNPEVHWSLYRELLFLSLTSCGAENIDIDAFDREYSAAYREIQREYSETLHPDDKMPSAKAVFCREAFEAPTLQPRRPRLF